MNHFIFSKFGTHTYTVHSKILGYTACQLTDWKGYQVVAVYANFTRRKSHDGTVKHIQVRTLATHILLEIVGNMSQLGEGEALRSPHPRGIGVTAMPHKLVQLTQLSQMSMKVGRRHESVCRLRLKHIDMHQHWFTIYARITHTHIIQVHTHSRTHTHARTCMYTHIRKHMHVHTHTHKHTHTHTHTHLCTYVCALAYVSIRTKYVQKHTQMLM